MFHYTNIKLYSQSLYLIVEERFSILVEDFVKNCCYNLFHTLTSKRISEIKARTKMSYSNVEIFTIQIALFA